MGILIGGWQTLFLLVAALIGITVTIALTVDSDLRGGAIPAGVITLFLIAGLWYSSTHLLLQPNEHAVVINSATGQIDGRVREAGVSDIPFFTANVKVYECGQSQQITETYAPSTKDNLGITAKVGMALDCSKTDWVTFWLRTNTDWNGYTNGLLVQRSQGDVNNVFHNYGALELRSKAEALNAELNTALNNALSPDGVVVVKPYLAEWDCVNASACQTLDAASIQTATASVQSATVDAKANTYTQWHNRFETLGITSDEAKLQLMQLDFFQQVLASGKPFNLIINAGNTNSSPAYQLQPITNTTPTK